MDNRERSAIKGINVKNRLKMFEADTGGSSSASNNTAPHKAPVKPPVASKAHGFATGSNVAPKPALKPWGGGAGAAGRGRGRGLSSNNSSWSKPNQDHNQNEVPDSPTKPTSPAKVNNAKHLFENKLSDAKEDNDSTGAFSKNQNGFVGTSNNADKRIPPKPISGLKPTPNSGLKPTPHSGLKPTPTSGLKPKPSSGLKPATRPKFGGRPSIGEKPEAEDESSTVKTEEAPPEMETKSGKALAQFLKKQTDSLDDSKEPPITSQSSPSSSTSSSSLVSTNTSGPHDFRSSLRSRSKPALAQTKSPPTSLDVLAKASSPSSPSSSTEETTEKPPSIADRWKTKEKKSSLFEEKAPIKTTAKFGSGSSFDKPKPLRPLAKAPSTEDEDAQPILRKGKRSQASNRKSSGVILRSQDGKKFRKVVLEDVPSEGTPPEKPAVPEDVDLKPITEQYHQAILDLNTDAASDATNKADEDDDDLYVDGTSLEAVLPRQPVRKRVSERISLIPDMTEEDEIGISGGDCIPPLPPEDEEGVEELIYDDGTTPALPDPVEEDIYDEGTSAKPQDDDLIEEDTYQDEESLAEELAKLKQTETEQEKKKRLKREEEARKKEAKEREKQREKEERERLNKEKEERNQRKKFQLTGDEIDVGEGTIIQDAKGRGKNLTVQKGEKVTIVRLDNNPANKFLVRSGTRLGFVDSAIIDIDKDIIQQAMKRNAKASVSQQEDDDQPTYDDVPEPIGSEEEFDNPDDEDIYEEFN